MAQVKSLEFALPKPQTNDGCAVFINDRLSVATNPVATDTLDFLIPKGIEVSYLKFYHSALAASGLAGSIGYAPVDPASTLAANTTYFKAAGTFGLSATGFECDFIPITFEEDVYLRITVTVTATGFSAGTIYNTIGGNMVGVR